MRTHSICLTPTQILLHNVQILFLSLFLIFSNVQKSIFYVIKFRVFFSFMIYFTLIIHWMCPNSLNSNIQLQKTSYEKLKRRIVITCPISYYTVYQFIVIIKIDFGKIIRYMRPSDRVEKLQNRPYVSM